MTNKWRANKTRHINSGWSTSFLTSDGVIYLYGKIDGVRSSTFSSPGDPPLSFPSPFRATTKDTHEPSTAIKQYSSGRGHILGLSDDGRIWSWNNSSNPACQVQLDNIQVTTGSQYSSAIGAVTKVAAGWAYSSAYVVGTGIVYWPRVDSASAQADGQVHIEAKIVPGTELRRAYLPREFDEKDFLGEVKNHIVLDRYIVFISDEDKAFAVHIDTGRIKELNSFHAPGRTLQDVQGAFLNFAVFTSEGEVLLGTLDLIIRAFRIYPPGDTEETLNPTKPPALQNSDVISIAFGDYHFCALHANGRISSHGREPQGCGALGLGGKTTGIPFRSIVPQDQRFNPDVIRSPFSVDSPRYIWFEPEKAKWLRDLRDKVQEHGSETQKTWETALELNENGLLEKYSECIERTGNSWDDFVDIREQDPDGLGAYFTLNVAAAGWQSAALVLVNEDLAKKIKERHILGHPRSDNGGSVLEKVVKLRSPNINTNSILFKCPEQPRYLWETQSFPTLLQDETGNIQVDGYDFTSWKYGLPPS